MFWGSKRGFFGLFWVFSPIPAGIYTEKGVKKGEEGGVFGLKWVKKGGEGGVLGQKGGVGGGVPPQNMV